MIINFLKTAIQPIHESSKMSNTPHIMDTKNNINHWHKLLDQRGPTDGPPAKYGPKLLVTKPAKSFANWLQVTTRQLIFFTPKYS
jgi:hypothetical protein